MFFNLLYIWIWLALLVSERLENKQNFLSTHNLRNLHWLLLWTIYMSSFSGNFMQHVSVIELLMVSFHTIRGIAIKQWLALVNYFVANFHHFVKKKIKIILPQIPIFWGKKLKTGKKKVAKNHHNQLQCESCLRFFYSHVLITKFD